MRILVIVDTERELRNAVDIFKLLIRKNLKGISVSNDEAELTTSEIDIVFRVKRGKGENLRGMRANQVFDLTRNYEDKDFMEMVEHIENLPFNRNNKIV